MSIATTDFFEAFNFERRAHSIYWHDYDHRSLGEMFEDAELPLSLKFSAVFAAFGGLEFPLKFSAFRSLVPDSVWREYFSFRRISAVAGVVPILMGPGEQGYELRIGTAVFNQHIVYMDLKSDVDGDNDDFSAPPDSSTIERFTLSHPFLEFELHDPSGIYISRSRS